MQVGDKFNTTRDACEAIKTYILDWAESFKTVASNKSRYIIVCKDANCNFYIWAYKSSKDVVSIRALDPYICSPLTYYKMK